MKVHNKSEAVEPSILKDYSTTIVILEHISDAIFILSSSGEIEYANRIATDMLREPLEALRGKNLDSYLFISEEQENREDVDPVSVQLEKEGSLEFEANLVNSDYMIPVMVSFGFIKDAAGHTQYVIVSAKNISIKKGLERELRQKQNLTVNRDRLRALGELAVGMIHELGQPVTALKLNLEFALQLLANLENVPPSLKSNLGRMEGLLDRAASTIEKFRLYANMVDDPSEKSVDIRQAVEAAVNLITYELEKRKIDLKIQSEESLPLISVNPVQIEQVVVTLFDIIWDAVDEIDLQHMADGGQKRTMEISLTARENKWIYLSLSSTILTDLIKSDSHHRGHMPGPADSIFQSDTRFALVREIIGSLGGDARLVSEKAGAATVLLRIPIDEKDERAQLMNLIELLHHK